MPRARMRLRSISPAEVICQFAFSENEIAVEVFPLAACHFDRMEVKDIFWQISCQNRRENGDNRGVSEGIRSERKCLRINDFHPLASLLHAPASRSQAGRRRFDPVARSPPFL